MNDRNLCCLVMTTVGSEEEAHRIAEHLLKAKLAACVSIFPVTSRYVWKGALQKEPEFQLLLKTTHGRFEELVESLKQVHSYEVPEILQVSVLGGSEDYLKWVRECVG